MVSAVRKVCTCGSAPRDPSRPPGDDISTRVHPPFGACPRTHVRFPAVQQSHLFHQVVDATRGQYDVLAELGHAPEHGAAYLAHDLATGGAVLLLVPPGADALDVVSALSDTVPAAAGRCTACGSAPATWTDACPHCGRSLVPSPDVVSPATEVIAAEAGRTIEIVGAVPHARGGQLYFGRDRSDQRLLAYAARPQGDARVWLDPLWEGEAAPAIAAPVAAPVAAPQPAPEPAPVPADTRAPIAATLPRRTRGTLVAVAAVALVLALGVAAWTRTRSAPSPAPPPTSSTHRLQRLTPRATADETTASRAIPRVQHTRPDSVALTVVHAGAIRQTQRAARGRVVAESTRAARIAPIDGAVLTIEGDLPAGWVRAVDTGGASSARTGARTSVRTVPLRPGVASVIVVEAPGYCPETLRITLDAGGRQEWEPTLRGRPVIGSCASN